MNRLDSISDSTGTSVACTYLGAGQIVKETDAGATLSYLNADGTNVTGLDRFGRVVDQIWRNPANDIIDEYMYGYDREGNRTYRKNVVAGASQNLDEAYTYDNLNQLASTQRGYMDLSTTPPVFNDSGLAHSWELDALGNWKSATTNGTTQTRTADAANEIATIDGVATTTYDTAGNMTSDGTLNYKYDAWNRLVEVTTMVGETERTVAEYKYDGANHRVEKTVYDLSIGDPTATTDYFYNQQWQVVEERMLPAGENQSTVVTQYVWDQSYIDTPVVRFRGSETLYYTTDANHNVTSLVDPAGEVVERYVYDAYGKVTFCGGLWTPLTTGGNNSTTRSGVSSAYVNEVLYCGYRYDPETSLVISTTVATAGNYQDRNRELITTLSTFDVRDPIGYAGGINLYEYCGDSPIMWTDPSGRLGLGPGYGCLDVPFLPRPPQRHCEVESGPVYTNIPYTSSGAVPIMSINAAPIAGGGLWNVTFHMYASFVNNPATGADCSCCEIRQFIKWTKGARPVHAGWLPASDFEDDTYYQDRNNKGQNIGHRGQPDPGGGYFNPNGTGNATSGCVYIGSDSPQGAFAPDATSGPGVWTFVLDVVDKCNGYKTVASSPELMVIWPNQTRLS